MFNLDSNFFYYLPGLILAITVHEFAHGYVSYLLGDPTPKAQGRLSLNPFHHLDWVGFLMMILFRFGWAKPVQINPFYFQDRKKGTLYVALAGPAANFITATVAALSFAILSIFISPRILLSAPGFRIFLGILLYNINLGLFNLIPVAPLDGSKVLESLLPPRQAYEYARIMNSYGLYILLAMMFTGAYRYFIAVPAQAMLNALLKLMQMFI